MTLPPELSSRFTEAQEVGADPLYRVVRARAGARAVAVRLVDAVLCLDPEMRERFLSEVRAAKRVRHPNLIELLEEGETGDGIAWASCAWVDGASLAKILEREGKLAASKVIGIGRALLSGVAALHEAGIVHRNLWPANVLLDRTGTLKIADVGIARDTAERLARLRGTKLDIASTCLAPEQLENGNISPATDVYAVGAILSQAMAADAPKALVRVVSQMMLPDPALRYADGKQALSAFKVASGDRSEAVASLNRAGANEPGESMVPMRYTGTKIPVPPPPPPPRAFANPPPELDHVPPPPPRVEKDPADASLVPSDAPAQLAIAISLIMILLVTLIALLIRWLR